MTAKTIHHLILLQALQATYVTLPPYIVRALVFALFFFALLLDLSLPCPSIPRRILTG